MLDSSRKVIRDKLLSRFFVRLIRGYQCMVRPLFPPTCLFVPSCSEFATQQIMYHGVKYGLMMFMRQFVKCHFLS